ncbi:MAG: riboflavin biosynthesis protein RibF, partial [Elusimicrobia bacterium]|nr:riboflavin biosynthesis protein RibF [Elusimicrobiota bacterium]
VISGHAGGALLTLPRERRTLLLSCGVDQARALPVGRRFLGLEPETFFTRYLVGKYKAGALLVGRDFAFGRNRAGHLDFLRRACEERGIPLFVLPFVSRKGHKISSSALRQLVHEGDMPAAAQQLGRHYSITGKVVHGRKLGRKLGFPTANLSVDARKLLPCGVFAAKARLGREVFGAVVNIGLRPTLKTGVRELVPEAHLLDFSRDIYGRELEVLLLKKLRGERKFSGLDALSAQMKKDASSARKILKFYA